MKPTFALDLSRDAIALLHRNSKGWLSIGEVDFDAPDLDEALDYLRKTALGLSPMGLASKIILPESQILYTEVTAPGPSRNDKRRQIAEALEGRTPYAAEDLVFDWSGKGATVKVAVVARETLEEAEAFAVVHRMNPVSFVAVPPEGSFVGEAWFGPTAASETLLAPGEVVDRDREAVTILHRELPGVDASVEAKAPAAVSEVPNDGPLPDGDDAPLPGLDEALNADLPPAAPTAMPEAMPETPALEPAPEPVSEPTSEPEPAVEASAGVLEDPAEVALAKALADAPGSETPAPPPAPEVEEAPFAHVTDTSAFPDGDTPSMQDSPAPDDDIPPAPSAATIAAFASRRAAAADASVGRPVGPAALNGKPDPRAGQPIPRPTPPKGYVGTVTAPSIPGTRSKVKGRIAGTDAAAASLGGTSAIKSPARPGGTFGTAAPPRNRTGVVFMVLVALLLIFLAVIAAWSSMWLSRNGSTQEDVGQVIDAPLPGVDDEMLADMQDPEGMTAPLPEAEGATPVDVGALATEDVPVDLALEEPAPLVEATAADVIEDVAATAADPAAADATPSGADEVPAETAATDPGPALVPEPVPAPVAQPVAEAAPEPQPEPAPTTAITTDVTAAQAPVEDQDEIFLAAMDAPPPALDALALPAPAAVVDTAPEAPMPPPAPGTVYRFDANGLVMPTPDGILSPEGVLLIAGPPPLLPPSRSEVAAAAALAAVPPAPAAAGAAPSTADASLVTATEAAEPVPSDPAMAGFRPRPRPEGLAPATEDDAAVATDTPTAVVGLRPLARPDSVLTLAAASRPASAEPADLGAQGASLAAQAEADLAAAAALEAQDPSIVAISRRPEARPRDLSRAVEAAVAAAVRAPEPEPQPEAEVVAAAAAAPAPELKPEEQDEIDEPETASAAPKIPTKASVAKQATYKNAINLSKTSLIGTYGTDSKRYALVRQSNGRYKKVKVGDRIDGGTVKAITATEVRYQKGGKLLTLAMPKA